MRSPSEHLLHQFDAVSTSSRVLDLGCGDGRHTGPLAELGLDLYACDTDMEAVATARENLAEVIEPRDALRRIQYVPNLAQLDYPDRLFDWIVAFNVYGRTTSTDELRAALAETRRILKPSGKLYVAVRSEDEEADGEATFSPEELDQLMQEADFVQAEEPATVDEEDTFIRGVYQRGE